MHTEMLAFDDLADSQINKLVSSLQDLAKCTLGTSGTSDNKKERNGKRQRRGKVLTVLTATISEL